MPNGRQGDHPYTDLVSHGSRGFYPSPIEDLLLELHRPHPDWTHERWDGLDLKLGAALMHETLGMAPDRAGLILTSIRDTILARMSQ